MALSKVPVFSDPPIERVLALLGQNNLPTADLLADKPILFLACGPVDDPLGIIGLEHFGEDGLLRSLVVANSARNIGCGKRLVSELEQHARDAGIVDLYLLTETAEVFFRSLGYQVIPRAKVSRAIQQSDEYSSLCADSATVMHKALR